MAMDVRISSALLDRLLAEARDTPEREICGLLFGTRAAIVEAHSCRNVADDPARRFEIDPAALLAAHRAARAGGPALVGSYHSHPSGSATPSACDAQAASPDGAVWIIMAGGEARGWRAVADGAVHGRFDPVALSPAG
jgi:proteasome lid subunit RPN8/RPN11